MQLVNYFENIGKSRVIPLFLFLFILVTFPILFSDSEEQQRITSYAQTTPAAGQTFWIFGKNILGDQLVGGGGNSTSYGAGSTCIFNVTEPPDYVYQGTHSISYEVTAPYADKCVLEIPGGVDISPYTYLTFYARASILQQSYGVSLTGGPDPQNPRKKQQLGTQVPMVQPQFGGPIPVDRWQVYNIPLSAFASPTNTIQGIGFADINGSSQPRVFLDEIALTTVEGKVVNPTRFGPPPPPLPTTAPPPDYYPQISPWVYIVPAIIILLAAIFQ